MLGFDKDSQERIFSVATARREGREIDEDNLLIARLMDMHPEFDEVWPQGEYAMIPQILGGRKVNPFVHIVLHGIIDGQIKNANPEIAATTFQRLKSGGLEEHEALHALMSVYGDLHFRGMRRGERFDHLEYEVQLEDMTVVDPPTPPDAA